MAVRIDHYSTTLPTGRPAGRRAASVLSAVWHLLLLAFLIHQSLTRRNQPEQSAAPQSERVIPLVFAPPRPEPTPRPPVTMPAPAPEVVAPLTPGPDQTPGSTARVTPTPEPEPNAPPNTRRELATRPDPGDADADRPTPEPERPVAPTDLSALTGAETRPTLESEARRIFGRPNSKLGPLAGTRDNRPWESPTESSNGCTLPPPDPSDSTVPAGMAVVVGVIYRLGTNQPLSGARLQILGTPYGTFTDGTGHYRLVFDRTLVDRCRTQSVRISAPGYEGRDVILSLGERASNDVPLRKY